MMSNQEQMLLTELEHTSFVQWSNLYLNSHPGNQSLMIIILFQADSCTKNEYERLYGPLINLDLAVPAHPWR